MYQELHFQLPINWPNMPAYAHMLDSIPIMLAWFANVYVETTEALSLTSVLMVSFCRWHWGTWRTMLQLVQMTVATFGAIWRGVGHLHLLPGQCVGPPNTWPIPGGWTKQVSNILRHLEKAHKIPKHLVTEDLLPKGKWQTINQKSWKASQLVCVAPT